MSRKTIAALLAAATMMLTGCVQEADPTIAARPINPPDVPGSAYATHDSNGQIQIPGSQTTEETLEMLQEDNMLCIQGADGRFYAVPADNLAGVAVIDGKVTPMLTTNPEDIPVTGAIHDLIGW